VRCLSRWPLTDRRWTRRQDALVKLRESGMPEKSLWASFFDPETVLDRLRLTAACDDVVDFGCGYGTFSIAAARRVRGTVFALDIDAAMLESARASAARRDIRNIHFQLRDFSSEGTGLTNGSVDYALLFNILHGEEPVDLLREAHRVLRGGGRLGIIHWNRDPETPRGPPMSMRPRPNDCLRWAKTAGFGPSLDGVIDLPPYHYGISLPR